MNHETHQNDLRFLRRANRTLGVALAVMGVGVLFLVFTVLSLVGSERTIVVPPNIEKTFWVSKDKVSGEYLEQMAGFMTWLVLDVSPSTIDWKRNVLLTYVAPDDFASLKTQMDLEAERLRSNNATTAFQIQQFTANEKQQSVVATGRLRRQINGVDVGDPVVRSYLIQFKHSGGRVHLSAFKEIPYGQNGQQPRTPDSNAAAH
jgi:conjugal transfer pilus assembly protein TraE